MIEVAKYVGRSGWVTITMTSKKAKNRGASRVKRLEPSVRPLTPGRWKDLVKLFGPRGACAGCWCMEPRQTRSEWEKKRGATNRRLMKRLVDNGKRPELRLFVKLALCLHRIFSVFGRIGTSPPKSLYCMGSRAGERAGAD